MSYSRSSRGSATREVELRATSYGREPASFSARVTEFDAAARWLRAGAVFLPLLAAALLSLPIPGWHLVAVPGFAAAAVILAARRLRQARAVETLEGPCPSCGERPPYPVTARAQLPLTLACPSCGEFLKLEELR